MATELEVNKKSSKKVHIKRLELEYKEMNYIIVNLEENVIDVNGELWEYSIEAKIKDKIEKMIWEYKNIDEYDYWPDKSKDHEPLSPMWRIAFYDEFDTYYHKSGALSYPPKFMELVSELKELKKL